MSTAQPVTSRVFHDAFTHNDAATNDSLAESVKTGDVGELPSGFSSINPNTVSSGANGALSEGHSTEDGETVYFGGFKSDEGKFAATNSKGEVLFYFNASQEKAIIAHLKAEGLIPENVNSFSQLGDRAIGVIENAVDQGVLGVKESGQLEVVEVPEDEAGEKAPSAGANRESDIDEKGKVTGEERENSTASTGDSEPNDSSAGATGDDQSAAKESTDRDGESTSEAGDSDKAKAEEDPEETTPEGDVEGGSQDDSDSAVSEGDEVQDEATTAESDDVEESSIVSESELDVDSEQAIAGGGNVVVDADGNVYVSGTKYLEADQAVPVSQQALNEAGLGEDPSAADVAKAFNEGRLGVVWPRDGSGNPTVVGISEALRNNLEIGYGLKRGPEMLDLAFSKNFIGHTDGVAQSAHELALGPEPETVNPTEGWSLKKLANGDYQLTNNRDAKSKPLTLTSEALNAAGVPEGEQANLTEMQMRQLMASGNLAVVKTKDGEQIAVGLSDVQVKALEEHTGKRGNAAVQAAYDENLLGVNSGTGRVVVTDPRDPSKVIRSWDKEGQSTDKKNTEYAPFKNNTQNSEGGSVSATVPVSGRTYQIGVSSTGVCEVVLIGGRRVPIPDDVLKTVGLSSQSTPEQVASKFADNSLVLQGEEVRPTYATAQVNGQNVTVRQVDVNDPNAGFMVTFEDPNIDPDGSLLPMSWLGAAGLTGTPTAADVVAAIQSKQINWMAGNGTWGYIPPNQ